MLVSLRARAFFMLCFWSAMGGIRIKSADVEGVLLLKMELLKFCFEFASLHRVESYLLPCSQAK